MILVSNIKKYLPNIWFSLFFIYLLRDVVYPSGTIISIFSLALVSIISVVCFFNILFYKKFRSPFIICWMLFIFYVILQFIFTADFSNAIHISIMTNYLLINIMFYSVYYFSREGLMNDNTFRIFFPLFLLAFIGRYYYNEQFILDSMLDSENVIVNNVGYYFTYLLAFLFFIKKKRLLLLYIIISFYFIIVSSKRGAILVGCANLLILFIYYWNSEKYINRFFKYVLILLGLGIIVLFITSNSYLIHRFSSGNSSGRSFIYMTLIDQYFSTNEYLKLLFGYGHVATIQFVFNEAHNDWLEQLIDYGLVGVLFYLSLLVSVFRVVCSRVLQKKYRYALFSVFITWTSVSLFSMYLFNMSALSSIFVLAYIMGKYDDVSINNNEYEKIEE